VIACGCPRTRSPFDDLVRGEITFAGEHVPDYVIVRANGQPLYTLVNPVDDALMGITHVLRGEDLLSSTPRQIALYEAFAAIGVGDGSIPEFGHLPYVMGSGNKKLSKRDPESNLLAYRDQGFLPEGLLNYLALLGWAIAEDRDVFSLDEMVEAFEIARVNPNPARFDIKKCEAINASHMRLLDPVDAASRQLGYLQQEGLVAEVPGEDERELVAAAMPLVQERILTFVREPNDAVPGRRDADFASTRTTAPRPLDDAGLAVVSAARRPAVVRAWRLPRSRRRCASASGAGRAQAPHAGRAGSGSLSRGEGLRRCSSRELLDRAVAAGRLHPHWP
jgi:glutamyl-tRNA synthetase